MKSISTAMCIVKTLEGADVDVIFGFPGETTLPLYAALQKQTKIKHVLARCPRCAGYMADAYARISGKIGFFDAPGGIGSPYAVPAMHEANNSSIPVILIASGIPRSKRFNWSTSHCDQQALFSAVTKKTILVESQSEISRLLKYAIYETSKPALGPVFFEIPADILEGDVSDYSSIEIYPKSNYPAVRIPAESVKMKLVNQKISNSKKPVIFAGGGVHLSGAVDKVREIVNYFKIPIATSLNGKGSIEENSALALGVAGSKGLTCSNEYLYGSDCIIVLGSKLGDKSTNGYSWPHGQQIIIHVDNDPSELHSRSTEYIPILSDINEFCCELLSCMTGFCAPITEIPKQSVFWEQGFINHLCNKLTKFLPEGAVLVADASVSSGWVGAAVKLTLAEQRVLTPRGSGSLGYALPAAIGSCFAKPDSRVFALGGDGGFAMAMHEMETAVRYNLPITYFLLNNCGLNLIDKHIEHSFGCEPVSRDFVDIDWCTIAKSFGWKTFKIENTAELDKVWSQIINNSGPVLVEMIVSKDELGPDFLITTKRSYI